MARACPLVPNAASTPPSQRAALETRFGRSERRRGPGRRIAGRERLIARFVDDLAWIPALLFRRLVFVPLRRVVFGLRALFRLIAHLRCSYSQLGYPTLALATLALATLALATLALATLVLKYVKTPPGARQFPNFAG
jgi:hypothetical protein